MKLAWIVVVVTACGGPPASKPMAPAQPPTPVATPSLPAPGVVDCRDNGSLSVVAQYCAHVSDGCCLPDGGWNCNNANYYDWWFKECAAK